MVLHVCHLHLCAEHVQASSTPHMRNMNATCVHALLAHMQATSIPHMCGLHTFVLLQCCIHADYARERASIPHMCNFAYMCFAAVLHIICCLHNASYKYSSHVWLAILGMHTSIHATHIFQPWCIYTVYMSHIYFNRAAHIRHVYSIHAAHLFYTCCIYLHAAHIFQPCCTHQPCMQHTCCINKASILKVCCIPDPSVLHAYMHAYCVQLFICHIHAVARKQLHTCGT